MAWLNWIERVGRGCRHFLGHVSALSRLTWATFYWALIAPFHRKAYGYRDLMFQMDRVGVKSFPIISLVCFLIGLILVLQTAYVVEPFGQLELVPGGVAISLTREIGPLLVAIVVTGRVGAAYTAELGAQTVSSEILALRCMAINPIGFLIAPRFLALLVMLPILTTYGNFMGILGGFVVGTMHYGIPTNVYWEGTFTMMQMNDFLNGIFKSLVFALIIAMIGCYKGFTVTRGSTAVGRATMEAVVTSMVLIIGADAVFTAISISIGN